MQSIMGRGSGVIRSLRACRIKDGGKWPYGNALVLVVDGDCFRDIELGRERAVERPMSEFWVERLKDEPFEYVVVVGGCRWWLRRLLYFRWTGFDISRDNWTVYVDNEVRGVFVIPLLVRLYTRLEVSAGSK